MIYEPEDLENSKSIRTKKKSICDNKYNRKIDIIKTPCILQNGKVKKNQYKFLEYQENIYLLCNNCIKLYIENYEKLSTSFYSEYADLAESIEVTDENITVIENKNNVHTIINVKKDDNNLQIKIEYPINYPNNKVGFNISCIIYNQPKIIKNINSEIAKLPLSFNEIINNVISPYISSIVDSTKNKYVIECGICSLEIKDMITLIPCGHSRFCKKCINSMNIKICPFCRKEYTDIMNIYI